MSFNRPPPMVDSTLVHSVDSVPLIEHLAEAMYDLHSTSMRGSSIVIHDESTEHTPPPWKHMTRAESNTTTPSTSELGSPGVFRQGTAVFHDRTSSAPSFQQQQQQSSQPQQQPSQPPQQPSPPQTQPAQQQQPQQVVVLLPSSALTSQSFSSCSSILPQLQPVVKEQSSPTAATCTVGTQTATPKVKERCEGCRSLEAQLHRAKMVLVEKEDEIAYLEQLVATLSSPEGNPSMAVVQ